MESLRWILLAAGVVFVLVIYILGRNRRRRSQVIENEVEDNLPEFSAQNFDDFEESVGEVKVITDSELASDDTDPLFVSREIDIDDSYDEILENDVIDNSVEEDIKTKKSSDIVVLYILPKPEKELMGSHVNSSAQAMGLKFGEMNIFHFKDGDRTVFSLANMLEPGSFDPNTIHDIKTTGLTVFMQFSGSDPLDDLTEMLQRSYQLSGLLDARLCNHKRVPLTEQDAENYRSWASDFMSREALKTPA